MVGVEEAEDVLVGCHKSPGPVGVNQLQKMAVMQHQREQRSGGRGMSWELCNKYKKDGQHVQEDLRKTGSQDLKMTIESVTWMLL